MYINEKKMAIEMTKKFAAAARKFGTQEYRNLQEARRDYPNFKVVTITRKAPAKDTFKGLNYPFMESYIEKHDDANQSIMKEYLNLRGLSEDAKDNLVEPYDYGKMKKWFLKKYPSIANFHKQCDELVAA